MKQQRGRGAPARAASAPTDQQMQALAEFAKGDDVGHGPDHDCMQCRQARQQLKKMNLSTTPGVHPADHTAERQGDPASSDNVDEPPPPIVSADLKDRPITNASADTPQASAANVIEIGVDEPFEPFEQVADRNSENVESLIRSRMTPDVFDSPSGDVDAGLTITTEASAEAAFLRAGLLAVGTSPERAQQIVQGFEKGFIAQRTDFVERGLTSPADAAHMIQARALDIVLDEAVDKALAANGMDACRPMDGDDDLVLIDTLEEFAPGMGVMLMQNYVPDDARWHCELNRNGQRVLVKHIERDVCIKLACLSLLDGKLGAQIERGYAEAEEAHRQATQSVGQPGVWSGQTQGVRYA